MEPAVVVLATHGHEAYAGQTFSLPINLTSDTYTCCFGRKRLDTATTSFLLKKDVEVSSRHALFTGRWDKGAFGLDVSDLGSTNGTRIWPSMDAALRKEAYTQLAKNGPGVPIVVGNVVAIGGTLIELLQVPALPGTDVDTAPQKLAPDGLLEAANRPLGDDFDLFLNAGDSKPGDEIATASPSEGAQAASKQAGDRPGPDGEDSPVPRPPQPNVPVAGLSASAAPAAPTSVSAPSNLVVDVPAHVAVVSAAASVITTESDSGHQRPATSLRVAQQRVLESERSPRRAVSGPREVAPNDAAACGTCGLPASLSRAMMLAQGQPPNVAGAQDRDSAISAIDRAVSLLTAARANLYAAAATSVSPRRSPRKRDVGSAVPAPPPVVAFYAAAGRNSALKVQAAAVPASKLAPPLFASNPSAASGDVIMVDDDDDDHDAGGQGAADSAAPSAAAHLQARSAFDFYGGDDDEYAAAAASMPAPAKNGRGGKAKAEAAAAATVEGATDDAETKPKRGRKSNASAGADGTPGAAGRRKRGSSASAVAAAAPALAGPAPAGAVTYDDDGQGGKKKRRKKGEPEPAAPGRGALKVHTGSALPEVLSHLFSQSGGDPACAAAIATGAAGDSDSDGVELVGRAAANATTLPPSKFLSAAKPRAHATSASESAPTDSFPSGLTVLPRSSSAGAGALLDGRGTGAPSPGGKLPRRVEKGLTLWNVATAAAEPASTGASAAPVDLSRLNSSAPGLYAPPVLSQGVYHTSVLSPPDPPAAAAAAGPAASRAGAVGSLQANPAMGTSMPAGARAAAVQAHPPGPKRVAGAPPTAAGIVDLSDDGDGGDVPMMAIAPADEVRNRTETRVGSQTADSSQVSGSQSDGHSAAGGGGLLSQLLGVMEDEDGDDDAMRGPAATVAVEDGGSGPVEARSDGHVQQAASAADDARDLAVASDSALVKDAEDVEAKLQMLPPHVRAALHDCGESTLARLREVHPTKWLSEVSFLLFQEPEKLHTALHGLLAAREAALAVEGDGAMLELGVLTAYSAVTRACLAHAGHEPVPISPDGDEEGFALPPCCAKLEPVVDDSHRPSPVPASTALADVNTGDASFQVISLDFAALEAPRRIPTAASYDPHRSATQVVSINSDDDEDDDDYDGAPAAAAAVVVGAGGIDDESFYQLAAADDVDLSGLYLPPASAPVASSPSGAAAAAAGGAGLPAASQASVSSVTSRGPLPPSSAAPTPAFGLMQSPALSRTMASYGLRPGDRGYNVGELTDTWRYARQHRSGLVGQAGGASGRGGVTATGSQHLPPEDEAGASAVLTGASQPIGAVATSTLTGKGGAPRRKRAAAPSASQDQQPQPSLKERVVAFIQARPALHEALLVFAPVNAPRLFAALREAGVQGTDAQLRAVAEELCITQSHKWERKR